MIYALTILVWGLVIGSLLWRRSRLAKRWQTEEVRRLAHLKMVQFRETHVERTQMLNLCDLTRSSHSKPFHF